MINRAYDWTPLGYHSDPIPGSPTDLDSHAATYRQTSTQIEKAVWNLDRFKNADEMSSETVSALMARAAETSGTLKALKVRYDAIAGALAGYSPSLSHAQVESVTALMEADRARTRARNAANQGNAAIPNLLSLDEGVRQRAAATYDHYSKEAGDARQDLRSAKIRLQAAIDLRNKEADKAAGAIDAVVDNSSLNDSILDKVGAFLEGVGKAILDALKWVWDHLDAILLVIDAIALLICLIPGGQGVGLAILGLTGVIGLIKGSIDYVGDVITLAKAIHAGFTTGDWTPCVSAYVSFAISGLALGVDIATAGKGGGVIRAAKDVAIGLTFYTVDEVWDIYKPKSAAAPAAERKVVPCWQ